MAMGTRKEERLLATKTSFCLYMPPSWTSGNKILPLAIFFLVFRLSFPVYACEASEVLGGYVWNVDETTGDKAVRLLPSDLRAPLSNLYQLCFS